MSAPFQPTLSYTPAAPSHIAYRKEVYRAADGEGGIEYDAFLNGRYIGSFPHEHLAWGELDRVAIEDARHSGLATTFDEAERIDLEPAANPLVPFGVSGGPSPDVHTLTPADIGRAVETLADFYERHPAVVQRIISAYDLALAALAERDRPEEERTVRVRENGDITVRGSKTYWISDHGCTCPDFRHLVYGSKYSGSGAESGLCKHTLCREALRLAQARAGIADATSGNPTAFTALDAAQLARALRAVGKVEAETVLLEITCSRARLCAGDIRKEVVSPECEGWGFRRLEIQRADALELGTALAAFAKERGGATVTLMLDAG
ncbi:MAG: hypothetical protein RLZZ387_255, partial [Chloroflexota bacterium]